MLVPSPADVREERGNALQGRRRGREQLFNNAGFDSMRSSERYLHTSTSRPPLD